MKKAVFAGVLGIGIGASVVGTQMNKIVGEREKNSEKFRIMYQMMERWMRIKQNGESLEKYFVSYGYKNIAIYGMAEIGKLLLSELKDSSIQVQFGIDKNKNATDIIPMYGPEEDLPAADAIIVTAIAYFDEIEKMLSEKNHCPIISLEDIVYEVL